MKKLLFILVIGIGFYSCKKTNREKNIPIFEINEAKQSLTFSLYNTTQLELKNITIGLPDTVFVYDLLQKESQTKLENIKSTYRYGFVRFYDKNNQKYFFQADDYVGEKLFTNGEMKFIIESIDTVNHKFNLEHIYKD